MAGHCCRLQPLGGCRNASTPGDSASTPPTVHCISFRIHLLTLNGRLDIARVESFSKLGGCCCWRRARVQARLPACLIDRRGGVQLADSGARPDLTMKTLTAADRMKWRARSAGAHNQSDLIGYFCRCSCWQHVKQASKCAKRNKCVCLCGCPVARPLMSHTCHFEPHATEVSRLN